MKKMLILVLSASLFYLSDANVALSKGFRSLPSPKRVYTNYPYSLSDNQVEQIRDEEKSRIEKNADAWSLPESLTEKTIESTVIQAPNVVAPYVPHTGCFPTIEVSGIGLVFVDPRVYPAKKEFDIKRQLLVDELTNYRRSVIEYNNAKADLTKKVEYANKILASLPELFKKIGERMIDIPDQSKNIASSWCVGTVYLDFSRIMIDSIEKDLFQYMDGLTFLQSFKKGREEVDEALKESDSLLVYNVVRSSLEKLEDRGLYKLSSVKTMKLTDPEFVNEFNHAAATLCTSDEFYKLYGAYRDQFNESNRIVNAVGGMENAFSGVTSTGFVRGSCLSSECFNRKFNMNLITKPLEAMKLAPTSKRIDESTINLSKMRSLFKR